MSYDYRANVVLNGALTYWLHKRGARIMPSRSDLDPAEMARNVLPHLEIIEVIDRGARFRYRLVGTALVRAFGREYTGSYSDELLPDDRLQFISEVYHTVCRARRPVFSSNRYITRWQVALRVNRIYLPLSDGGHGVDHLLAALTFEGGRAEFEGRFGDEAVRDSFDQRLEEIDLVGEA